MKYSYHFSKGCQQRVLPPLAIQLLLDFGDVQHNHDGTLIYYFSKRSIKNVRHNYEKLLLNKIEKFFKISVKFNIHFNDDY